MVKPNQNFSMYQGETKNLVVTVIKEDGTALNLTGCSVTWALQRGSSGNNLITKSTPNQIAISGNILTVQLIPSDTTSLNGTFSHECKMTDTNGNVSELFTGIATIMISDL